MLDFIVYIAVGILAGLGVGSGGLLLLYLTLFLDMPLAQARSVNLLFFATALIFAFIVNSKKRLIEPSLSLWLIVFGVIGSFTGILFIGSNDSSFLRTLFGIFLILGGGYSLFVKKG